jgi:hypothetical protein
MPAVVGDSAFSAAVKPQLRVERQMVYGTSFGEEIAAGGRCRRWQKQLEGRD